jgi:kynurenine formamidase
VDDAALLALADACDNTDRWPDAPGRGTLNYVDASTVVAAVGEVRDGVTLSIALPLAPGVPGYTYEPLPPEAPTAYADAIRVAPHGFGITHLDAPGHTFQAGRTIGGATRADTIGPAGLRHGAITDLLPGVVTRGVLLDVATARGLAHLERGAGIGIDDLRAAEELAGTAVRRGDAVFLRTGIAQRLAAEGVPDEEPREGILPEVIGWLHERQVAVYSGDCIERMPSGSAVWPMPLHQIGHTRMGLVILDNVDMEALARECASLGRATFLLVCGPLPLVGASGSPVAPIVVF